MITPRSSQRPRSGGKTRLSPAGLAAPLALVAVAFIWGSSNLVAQTALMGLSVPLLLALRFSVAALLLSWVRPARAAWQAGVPLGLLFFLMYAAHTQGLTGTTAARAAFITGSSALLVPFLGWWAGERPAWGVTLAAFLGVSGLGVMLSGPLRPTAGDGWELLAAVLFAVYVRLLGRASPGHTALSLVFPQLCVMALLAWVWALPRVGELARLSLPAACSALYLGVFANLAVMALQSFALRTLAPERAALWLLLGPVFALALSGLVLRVLPPPNVVLGGVVVLLALVLSQQQAARPRGHREAPAPPALP